MVHQVGLAYEGLSRRRIGRMGVSARYRFLRGRGMVSDDTDHAALVVHALAESAGEPGAFERRLRRNLRRWFLAIPAGVGMATSKSCIRMCLGFRRPGVYSAGNGPAMRAAVLGAAVDDPALLVELVRIATMLTHTDLRAFHGALAVALAAQQFRTSKTPDIGVVVRTLRALAPDLDPGFGAEFDGVADAAGMTTSEFAISRGYTRCVSGFIVHSVPVALHAAFSHRDDPVAAAMSCIACGGDTDTTAAIAAGIVGAGTGVARTDADGPGSLGRLVDRIWDWPRGVRRLEEWGETAARALESGAAVRLRLPAYLLCLARNLLFLCVVLGHVGRRGLPPY